MISSVLTPGWNEWKARAGFGVFEVNSGLGLLPAQILTKQLITSYE